MATDAQLNEAIDWRIRLRHGRDGDWEAFSLWLEVDPAHAAAYDLVALSEDAADIAVAGVPVAANDAIPTVRPLRRYFAWGGGIAAAIVAGLVALPQLADHSYVVSTRPGEQRTLSIGGTEIALNGGTRIRIDPARPRSPSLEAGEARFAVRHDAANPFVITAGDARLTDVGTTFDVVRTADGLRVSVAEGAVAYDRGARHVELRGGQRLRVDAGGKVSVVAAPAASVGGWRLGRLAYQGAPILEIVADIERTSGMTLRVDPSLAQRPFTGVIRLHADRQRTLSELGSLLDVVVQPHADGWLLAARDRTPA